MFRDPDQLDEQSDRRDIAACHHPVQVVCRRGDHFGSGRDDRAEPQTRIVVRKGAKHGTGLRDHAQPARRHRIESRKAGDAQPDFIVVETHAVSTANGHSGIVCDRTQSVFQTRYIRVHAGGEDRGGTSAMLGRGQQRILQPLVADTDDNMVGLLGQFLECPESRQPFDHGGLRIDREDVARKMPGFGHGHHGVA